MTVAIRQELQGRPCPYIVGAMERKTVNLLWTGGWDSTYRLLDLVLVQGRQVQPYYIIDHRRPSASIEMETMDRIRGRLAARGHLVLPTRLFAMNEVAPYAEITDAYRRIKERGWLGDQYEWLGRWRKQHSIEDLELSVHREANGMVYNLIKDNVYQDDDAAKLVENPEPNELQLFSGYRFPVLHLEKRTMQAKAIAAGFADIMDLTWFCHHPVRGRACGKCNPCRYAIAEGMGNRIPWSGHVRSYAWPVIGPARRIAGGVRRRLRRLVRAR